MKEVHEVLYRITKSAPFGLDITSSRFLNGMDSADFQLSRIRMDYFIAAVDAEVSVHMRTFSVVELSSNL